MKVTEVLLPNGLVRLDIEPTCSCERNIPTHVVDEIMRDVIRRKNSPCAHKATAPSTFGRPTPPRREPDGIDIHVDRPLRENFHSHHAWCDAIAKYRTLEHVAKDCNWPCREPMKSVQQPQPLHRPQQTPRPTWDWTCAERFVDIFDDDDDFGCNCGLFSSRVW